MCRITLKASVNTFHHWTRSILERLHSLSRAGHQTNDLYIRIGQGVPQLDFTPVLCGYNSQFFVDLKLYKYYPKDPGVFSVSRVWEVVGGVLVDICTLFNPRRTVAAKTCRDAIQLGTISGPSLVKVPMFCQIFDNRQRRQCITLKSG